MNSLGGNIFGWFHDNDNDIDEGDKGGSEQDEGHLALSVGILFKQFWTYVPKTIEHKVSLGKFKS